MSKQLRVLLDTNIWLDFYLGERPCHTASNTLLRKLIDLNAAILYPATALTDVAYILTASLKREHQAAGLDVDDSRARAINEIAWACIANMTELAAIAPLDFADVRIGVKHRVLHDDLEDDMVIAAALRAEVDYLVTNDKAFLERSPLPTLSSSAMLALLAAQYD